MKIIAFYLPQFHRIPENDQWWGDGFTDWTTVKKAKPLWDNHNQPRKPLEGYYDLLDKNTMQWQAGLMSKYGVDGLCFYHYWFKDGKMVLEKPAENLLEWQDINMPFCFCWANQTWARSWSNIKGANKWAETVDRDIKSDEKSILLEQKYGLKRDWKEHFMYLLPFFKDSRYIRVEGKPLFMIFRPTHCVEISQMIEYWNELAKENGLNGLYTIGMTVGEGEIHGMNGIMLRQPAVAFKHLCDSNPEGKRVFAYEKIWDAILDSDMDGKTYYSGFVDYDDTPRRVDRYLVSEGFSADLFRQYLSKLIKKNEKSGNDITFINAWNEWGEGMYLEPDSQNGYKTLEMINESKKDANNETTELEISPWNITTKKTEKDTLYLSLLDKWMELKEKGVSLSTYLLEKGIKTVGIYGYGIFGKHLMIDALENNLSLNCIIDKDKKSLEKNPYIKQNNIEILSPEEEYPFVDAVVVTAPYYFEDIYNRIKEKSTAEIISIQHIIRELCEN